MSVIEIENPAEHVLLLRINRPEARNALSMEVRRRLAEILRAHATDPATRCAILTGTGKSFAAGADIKEMAEAGTIEMMQRGTRPLWKAVADFPKPLIAAVNGYALGGGCELAMHADIIIAAESAQLGQPEVRIGLMPGGGGTQRLMRAVGKFKAMKLLLTGDPVPAAEAFAMGLVSEVVPDDKLMERAVAMASTIAAMAPIAVQQIKEVALAGEDGSLDGGLLLERKAFEILFASEDQKEGIRAFLEKRKPQFKGK